MTPPIIAYQFDLKRAMWTRPYMDAFVDRLRDWGYNTVLYELEDKFRFSEHPAIVHPDAPTHAETADFVAGCRARGVEVIPLVQSLGHAEYVVGKPAYARLRERPEVDSQYDPLSDEARALIFQLFDEVIDVFQPQTFFHMGGDETWSLGTSEKCAEIVSQIGVGGLYFRHMQPLFAHVQARGLRPIIWADVALTHPEMIGEIPADVVMMDWDYWTTAERPDFVNVYMHDPATGRPCSEVRWADYATVVPPAYRRYFEAHAVDEQTRRDGTFRGFCYTDALRAMGFQVITASANRSYEDMVGIPNYARHLPNCFFAARKARTGLGLTVTSWAVRHNHPETTVFSTYAAMRALRDDAPYDPERLGAEFAAEFYGAPCPQFTQLALQAGDGLGCTREYGLREMQELLAQGQDPLADKTARLIDEYGSRDAALAAMEGLLQGYDEARDGLTALRRQATRNARNLDYWLEGIALHRFYLEFMHTALTDALSGAAADWQARLADLRAGTRALFADTYAPVGLEGELEMRYGLHDRLLEAMARK